MASTTSSTSGREATTDTVYFQDGQQTLADYEAGTAAGSPSYTYIYADYIDEPVLRIDSSGGKLSYHRNQQYSIVALTDSTGAIVERYAYTAYGEPTILSGSGSPQPFTTHKNRYQYTGREWDEKLSLYHHRARMYSPVAGRFVSRDPISYIGSEWSLYEYVDGGPLRKVDPFGKWGISVYERDDQICGVFNLAAYRFVVFRPGFDNRSNRSLRQAGRMLVGLRGHNE